MTTEEFWRIVQRVHTAAGGVMERKCELLPEELRGLSIQEVRSFGEHFRNFWQRAYDWDLWAAAYIICGGCGDDSFMDFRSTLVSLGPKVYEKALANADSRAEFDYGKESPSYEGYQYVPGKVFGEKIEELGLESEEEDPVPQPREPSGTEFKTWDLERRFPKLCAKYEHKDADCLGEKEREERVRQVFQYLVVVNGKRESVEGRLSRVLLAGGDGAGKDGGGRVAAVAACEGGEVEDGVLRESCGGRIADWEICGT
jgi:hypothetical protein